MPETSRSPSPGTLPGISWNLQDELVLDDDPWKKAATRIAQSTLNFLNGDLSEEEEDERSDLSEHEFGMNAGMLHSFSASNDSSFCVTDIESEDETSTQQLPKKRPRNYTADDSTVRHWYPWQDRIVSFWNPMFLRKLK